jgi:adenosylmethionine-8-amino-7-oxononanoate aminotransferase
MTRSTGEYQAIDASFHHAALNGLKTLKHDGTRPMVRARGLTMWDSDGNPYLDGISGRLCTQVGFARRELIEAAARQLELLSCANLFCPAFHPAVIALSERLLELLSERFSHVIYTNSGSEAHDVMIRTVRRYWAVAGKPDKTIFIARVNSSHGSTMGCTSPGRMGRMHEGDDMSMSGIVHIGEPWWFAHGRDLTPQAFGLDCARQLENQILALGAHHVAAFIAEPFQGAGGVIMPPESYWPEIQRICRKYDVLLCADEVTSGLGRSGRWFAHQYFSFQPDTLTLAKGLTSGYFPMGGLVLSRNIAETLIGHEGLFARGLTCTAHPVAAAVALANLDVLLDGGVVEQVRKDSGPYLQRCLRQACAEHPLVGEIQGVGMAAALQLVEDKGLGKRFDNEADIVSECCGHVFDEGVILHVARGRLILAPALVASHAEIDQLVEKTARALDFTGRRLGVL